MYSEMMLVQPKWSGNPMLNQEAWKTCAEDYLEKHRSSMEKTLENLVANLDATRQREKVIKFLIRNATNFGFQPLEVDDGGDIALEVGTEDEVLDVVFSVNCSTIRFTGHGRIHEVEVDLTQEPGEILVDSSSNPNWEACLKEVDKFCESLPTGRPALTHREHQLLNALTLLHGWCIQKLEPFVSGTAMYPALARDMGVARKAIHEATGGNA